MQEALLEALTFRPYPDVPDALRVLREAGHRVVVVSNWDVSLHDALRSAGLTELLDGAISSAEAGFEKPDPRIFAARARARRDERGRRAARRRHDRATTSPERAPRAGARCSSRVAARRRRRRRASR